ncbi:UDP-2,3-diacylglucosamine diphosphatase [Glaesserella sp.]|uniref:UDP-2,3-diacylglucosamine diphosphatase n=1 Tax=Glaesserella sp. TaxID=2094731 RepID=UPI0035A14E04
MTTYFIADLHLNESQPEVTALFLQFMRENAPLAEAVYILGDLFDFWIGDDEQSVLIHTVKQAIRQVTEKGVPCYFIHGNRDFLIGKRFAEDTGITLLPDYQLIDLYNKKTLICHGDTLCIDDINYQQYRRKVHQKWRQYLFLCLPLSLRLKIAQKIRAKSRTDKQQKPAEIMDVNPDFTAQVVDNYQAEQLIHGHTHRQAVHTHSFPPFAEEGAEGGRKQCRSFTRIVLGDWGKTASILAVSPQGFAFNEER